MYLAYKLIQVALQPQIWIFVILVTAWFLARYPHRRQTARHLLLSGIILFYVLGISPTGYLLLRGLESMYPTSAIEGQSFDAVVVLASGTVTDSSTGKATVLGTDSVNRVICGMRIMRQTTSRTMIVTGGIGDPFQQITPDAEAMQDFAMEFGLPASSIVAETVSRHTAESAVAVRRLIPDARRIAVVTAASHLPRSVALFRKQGFDVTPVPCTYLSTLSRWSPTDFLPSPHGFAVVNLALHEYVGLAVYRLGGRL